MECWVIGGAEHDVMISMEQKKGSTMQESMFKVLSNLHVADFAKILRGDVNKLSRCFLIYMFVSPALYTGCFIIAHWNNFLQILCCSIFLVIEY